MTVKEMENISGIPRANIRFYEEKGLLSPARSENGYRVYSEADVTALRRIALLRSLDVSLEEIAALQKGEKALSSTMQEKLAVWEKREKQAAHAQTVCRAIQADRVEYASLDVEKYQCALPEKTAPREDCLPYPNLPLRRFLARGLDEAIYSLIWAAVLTLGFGVNLSEYTNKMGFVDTIVVMLMTVAIEPVLLHAFGTTIGKWIFGLRLETEDGTRPDCATARARTLMVLWRGKGLGIPVYGLVRLWKSGYACGGGEQMSWDYENSLVYTVRDERRWRYAPVIALHGVIVFLLILFMQTAELPPHRGNLTVAEFSENYNHFSDYYGLEGSMLLDEHGKWTERNDGGVIIRMEDSRCWPEFEFRTDAEGNILEMGFIVEIDGQPNSVLFGGIKERALQAALSFIGAKENVNALSFMPRALARQFDGSMLEEVDASMYGVDVRYTAISRDYMDVGGGLLLADDDAAPYLRIDFVLKDVDSQLPF